MELEKRRRLIGSRWFGEKSPKARIPSQELSLEQRRFYLTCEGVLLFA
jgi:hypothetical protein